MGKPMNKNLLKTGYELVIFDFDKDTMNEVVSCSTIAATNGKEVAEQCEAVITMIPSSPHVRAAVLGENSATEDAKPGTVVIDMSSINPTESKTIDAELAKLGIDMLGIPVSGGGPKAIDGTLSVMVDGRREFFNKYYDMLMVMTGSVVYVDGPGSSNVAKLANQIVVVVNIATVSEALTFAKKARTGPELVYQAVRGRLAGSTVMDARAPMVLSRNFKPGFRIELYIKDLNNALNAAHAISSPASLAGQLMEIMQDLRADGHEKEDHSSIVKYYGRIANTAIES